jgi:hypothetical protein
MPTEHEEIARAFADVRAKVEGKRGRSGLDALTLDQARDEAERFWPVSAERENFARPGARGRARAFLVASAKAVLRPLLRWYVEPALADQRRFNAAVLRILDELEREVRRHRRG